MGMKTFSERVGWKIKWRCIWYAWHKIRACWIWVFCFPPRWGVCRGVSAGKCLLPSELYTYRIPRAMQKGKPGPHRPCLGDHILNCQFYLLRWCKTPLPTHSLNKIRTQPCSGGKRGSFCSYTEILSYPVALCSSHIFARSASLRPLVTMERTPHSHQVQLSLEDVRVLQEEHGRNPGFLLGGRRLKEEAVVWQRMEIICGLQEMDYIQWLETKE